MRLNRSCLYCLSAIGSNEFASTSLHTGCYLKCFGLTQLIGFEDFSRKQSVSESVGELWNSSHFQGRFKKYSATLAGQSYILKVREADYPELPDVEYICNKIGKILGLDVADFYIIEIFGQRAFVTKNFIKKGRHPETLNHIYHYMEPKVQDFDCETLISIIERQTGNILETEKFVRVCLFDTLIGNNDRHGRNLGFLVRADRTRLSPVYDNPSALGIEQGEFLKADWNPTGKISTKQNRFPSAKDYASEFIRLGFKGVLDDFVMTAERHLASINKSINDGFCSVLMKEALTKLIFKRFKELKNETSKK